MQELTVTQAEEYTKQRGKPLSRSYLVRAARDGVIKARKVEMPTGVGFWMIDQDALDSYLASPRKPGPKIGSHHKKSRRMEEETLNAQVAA